MWLLYMLLAFILLFVSLILFAIFPGRRRNRSPFDRTLYAHRGLHSNDSRFPENSLVAFRLAREAGYGVELDVQFTADHQVVVFHDDTLLRMCGIDRRVDELSYAELSELRLLDSDQRIPLLTEVLETLDGATVLCEIKPMRSYTDTSLCEAALAILREYKGTFCVESFNPMMMRWFYKNAPDVVRGILSKRFTEEDKVAPALATLLGALLTNFLSRPDFIAYQHTDRDHPFFRFCKLFHPMTLSWTIRNQAELDACQDSFDSHIFEGFKPEKFE